MHDFRDDYEMDKDGKLRKKKRVMPDGATMHVPMGFYDGRFFPTFADNSPDHTSPHQPGYRFADTNDADRLAADDAYEQMRQRLSNTWRDKRVLVAEKRDTAPLRVPTLDQLQAQAQEAWQARNERMRNSWRTNKEA